MTGYAMRVFLTNASLTYFVFAASRPVNADDVNAYFEQAANEWGCVNRMMELTRKVALSL